MVDFADRRILTTVREGLAAGLQRGDIAAELGLSPEEFEQHIAAGCSPTASAALRGLARAVVEEENHLKRNLIEAIREDGRSTGAIWLLEKRFKGTWGKDAKPPAESLPATQVDWDAALRQLADDPTSPLVAKLRELGFERRVSATSS